MRPIYSLTAVMLLALTLACCKKNGADPQAASTGTGTGSIKLTQNGKVITEFQTTKVTAIGGGGYDVVVNSADEKHSLLITITGQSAGTYPFIAPGQSLGSGKANFLYQSYALPEAFQGTVGILEPSTGQVDLKTATQTRCSGTFSGTGKNAKDGKTYTLEGTFDSPVL